MGKYIAFEYITLFRSFILSSEMLQVGLTKGKILDKMEVTFHNAL
jgi:hypothetical protein